jgi:hypothetical protein
MKLLVISISAALLAASWSLNNEPLSIAGVIAKGLLALGWRLWQVRASRLYRQGEHDKRTAPKITGEKEWERSTHGGGCPPFQQLLQ